MTVRSRVIPTDSMPGLKLKTLDNNLITEILIFCTVDQTQRFSCLLIIMGPKTLVWSLKYDPKPNDPLAC